MLDNIVEESTEQRNEELLTLCKNAFKLLDVSNDEKNKLINSIEELMNNLLTIKQSHEKLLSEFNSQQLELNNLQYDYYFLQTENNKLQSLYDELQIKYKDQLTNSEELKS